MPVPANRQPGPPRLRPSIRKSSVDAIAVRRLAARRASTSAAPQAAPHDEPARDATQEEETAGQEETAAQEQAAHLEVEEAAYPDDARHRDRPGHAGPTLRLIAGLALAVMTLVLGGLAAWFGTEASSLDSEPSAQNQALADPSETSQVTSQVTSAIKALFSYNYANPSITTKAASRLLTGAAVKEYAALFAEVKEKAPKEKLIVTTAVSSAGVELLTPNTARVLVFATESDGSAGASTPSTAGAMLAVNVVLDGGAWKIAGIDTFSG